MNPLPSRLRRLDDALADLPLDEPMLLTELDGYLTGILVGPDLILVGEWLPYIWGTDEVGGAPFDDPADVQWFTDAVLARYNEIMRDMERGKPKPIFDTDPRNGDLLWEPWADGFAQAMTLRPDAWSALLASDDADLIEALANLSTLIAVARDESTLDSMEINAVHDRASAELADIMLRLHAARPRAIGGGVAASVSTKPAKVGRNEPCCCGSGKKSKRCCG